MVLELPSPSLCLCSDFTAGIIARTLTIHTFTTEKVSRSTSSFKKPIGFWWISSHLFQLCQVFYNFSCCFIFSPYSRRFHIFPAPSQHINFLPKAVQGPLSLGTREHGDWTTFAHLASKRAFKERPWSVGRGGVKGCLQLWQLHGPRLITDIWS